VNAKLCTGWPESTSRGPCIQKGGKECVNRYGELVRLTGKKRGRFDGDESLAAHTRRGKKFACCEIPSARGLSSTWPQRRRQGLGRGMIQISDSNSFLLVFLKRGRVGDKKTEHRERGKRRVGNSAPQPKKTETETAQRARKAKKLADNWRGGKEKRAPGPGESEKKSSGDGRGGGRIKTRGGRDRPKKAPGGEVRPSTRETSFWGWETCAYGRKGICPSTVGREARNPKPSSGLSSARRKKTPRAKDSGEKVGLASMPLMTHLIARRKRQRRKGDKRV